MRGKLHIARGEQRQAVSASKFKLKKESGSVQPAQAVNQGHFPSFESGAGNESRTRDLNLGKVALYQLSYSRMRKRNYRSGAFFVKKTQAVECVQTRPVKPEATSSRRELVVTLYAGSKSSTTASISPQGKSVWCQARGCRYARSGRCRAAAGSQSFALWS